MSVRGCFCTLGSTRSTLSRQHLVSLGAAYLEMLKSKSYPSCSICFLCVYVYCFLKPSLEIIDVPTQYVPSIYYSFRSLVLLPIGGLSHSGHLTVPLERAFNLMTHLSLHLDNLVFFLTFSSLDDWNNLCYIHHIAHGTGMLPFSWPAYLQLIHKLLIYTSISSISTSYVSRQWLS